MLLLSVALLAIVLLLGLQYIFSYWHRHGLPHLKPEIPYGNLRSVAKRQQSLGVAITELYRRSTEPLVGIYLFFTPAILVRDATLAKRILTVDFGSFQDRGVLYDKKRDLFSCNMFAAPLSSWRPVRSKLTAAFSLSQLRGMLPTVLDVGTKLEDRLGVAAESGDAVDLNGICMRYVVDVIAEVLFGFKADSIGNPEHPFYTIGEYCDEQRSYIRNVHLSSISRKVSNFMISLVRQQMKYRAKNDLARKDFLQLLTDLHQEDLSVEECAANVNLFYTAGSETTKATVIYTLHELAHHPEVMGRLVEEVDECLKQSGGEISYDLVKSMSYLDVCRKETLRKYPGLFFLNRKCTHDYQVPNSWLVIKKGTQLVIPLKAYGMDERYFPNPESYIPERFLEDTKNYDENAYAPFGNGPRKCIAPRMGIFVAKVTLVRLLSKFRFEATQELKIEFAPSVVPLVPKDGVRMKIHRRCI
ncbi:cytochrome P450 6d3 [Culex quinquefasciatus]|uniref:Cytochrome P450 6d3 n=1 Tax=Culex quinquefasciatus TaxID=7176 RepID=B0XJW5_CULQU|nr:cytochrome P450 6d3 [Culex quinquefasciatus]|eukprot:XP_001869937.1 cytochrome P450 6d3 [Culex quinquefasciatus]